MIELNDLLIKAGLDPRLVMVMRHRPKEKQLRDVLPWLAAERNDVYNAFQSEHSEKTEAALSKATHLVSFIGHAARRAMFVGAYSVERFRRVSAKEFREMPHSKTLRTFGAHGPADERSPLWFDLQLLEHFQSLKGRLVVEWPGVERSWWRWAGRNSFPVHAIHDESLLVPSLPDWQSLTLSWQELQALPASWKQALSQWRGIYFIYDEVARMGYVGAAYGSENLMGRWTQYAATGHGGNRLLRTRSPENFVFSILQRVSPDMDADEVIAIESSWKERLHTRSPQGLNDN